jgi:hypothetical protein
MWRFTVTINHGFKGHHIPFSHTVSISNIEEPITLFYKPIYPVGDECYNSVNNNTPTYESNFNCLISHDKT